MRQLTLIMSFFLLTACSQSPVKQTLNLSNDNKVTLLENLQVAASTSRVFIQNGQVTSKQAFDRYTPHCRFQLQTSQEGAQSIQADDFVIIEVQEAEEEIALQQPIMLASLSIGIGINYNLSNNDNNRAETFDLVHLYLKPTTKNPEIFRLTCAGALSNGAPEDGVKAERPNLKRINQILGNLAKIH